MVMVYLDRVCSAKVAVCDVIARYVRCRLERSQIAISSLSMCIQRYVSETLAASKRSFNVKTILGIAGQCQLWPHADTPMDVCSSATGCSSLTHGSIW